jgi:hypothetical protein
MNQAEDFPALAAIVEKRSLTAAALEPIRRQRLH